MSAEPGKVNCVDCKRGTWPAYPVPTLEQRVEFKARGWRRFGARGLCVTCYVRHKKAGDLDSFLRFSRNGLAKEPEPCTRCGVKHVAPGRLCFDCRDVTTDLDELETWVHAGDSVPA